MTARDDDPRATRRGLLWSMTAVGAAGLAGCFGTAGSGSDGGPAAGDGSTTAGDPTTGAESTSAASTTTEPAASLDEPVAVDDDDRCIVCNMKPAKYPAWNAQLTLDADAGRRAYFDSPGCLVAFRAAPEHFVDGATHADVVGAWAHDYASGDLVDAAAATWVLETDADRIDAPMMQNPLPFADPADARAYVDRYDDLTVHDLVGLDAFDVPLARTFRATFLPETDAPSVIDPAPVPEDGTCAVCGMAPSKHPSANAQLTVEDGGRSYFCSPGCLTAYYAVPSQFDAGRSPDDVVGAWAHDYASGDLVDATAATWVLETDAERVDLPMGPNPLPFADPADARAYVERTDGLSASDLVGLDAFDRAVARSYRGKFL